MNEKRKPGKAFWCAAVTFVLLAYPLSFGPVCWLNEQTGQGYADGVGYRFVRTFYLPVLRWIGERRPDSDLVYWYARAGTRNNVALTVGYSRDESGRLHDVDIL